MSKYHIYYLRSRPTCSRSLLASFPGQLLIGLIIYFGESGRGSVREAVICYCGNMWVGVFVIIILIIENHNGASVFLDMH